MKFRMTPLIILTVMVVSTLVLSMPAHAAGNHKEEVGTYGYIDWLNQTVYARGLGLAPKNKRNTPQAVELAERAAIVVAQRNLLEVIKGVHIDSQTLVENKIVANDHVVSEIQGMVRFSKVEYSKELSRDTVEVVVSMPLTGNLGDILVTLTEDSGG